MNKFWYLPREDQLEELYKRLHILLEKAPYRFRRCMKGVLKNDSLKISNIPKDTLLEYIHKPYNLN